MKGDSGTIMFFDEAGTLVCMNSFFDLGEDRISCPAIPNRTGKRRRVVSGQVTVNDGEPIEFSVITLKDEKPRKNYMVLNTNWVDPGDEIRVNAFYMEKEGS